VQGGKSVKRGSSGAFFPSGERKEGGPGIFKGVGNLIWNNFHVNNFFQISTDFELI
jgi:hypothetical protein